MPASDGGDDFVGIGDPLEGFGTGVVVVEEAIDRFLKVGDRSEDAAFEAALGEGGEETLDGVEPGGRCRSEVECPARMARDPLANGRVFVGGVIVEDRVDGLAGGNLAFDRVEKADELLTWGASGQGVRFSRALIILQWLFRYPRSEPGLHDMVVSAPDQPHIRSPREATAPISRLRRVGLRRTRPF